MAEEEQEYYGYYYGDEIAAQPVLESDDQRRDENLGKIIVNGLSSETSASDLKAYFSKHGEVTNCVLNPKGGSGVVVFKDASSVTKVLEVSDHKVHSKSVAVKKAK